MNSIKNIIFDLGGVLLRIDYDRPIEEFRKLGLPVDESFYSKKKQSPLFDDLEMGKISVEDFRNEVRKKTNRPLTDEEIDQAWNSILLDYPKERMEMLYELKNHYRLFMLSNTNAIHLPAFYNILQNDYDKNIFAEVFERCYFSHEIGMRKPHADIFNLVLQENNLTAGETLFIDDSKQHVEGASKLGIHAKWLNLQKENVVDFIKNSGLI